ncbi:MAG TPA: sigma-70 family RNA polymerase sigma factor [Ktedonobacterales bacterium]|nr:sigma-70 family RNA polymerase sigma factor [Ktedonobacterales bacterium]
MPDPAPSLVALSVEAFNDILARFQGALVRFVRGLVGNGEDARDLVQDVFVDAWRATQRRAPPFTTAADERAVRNWLFHAAYCNAVSALRHRGVIVWESLAMYDSADDEPAGPAGFEERIVEGAALRAALATLEAPDLACLRLKIIEGFSAVEIGGILEIAPHAARKRLSRAMQRLRASYFAQQVTPGSGANHE